MAGKWEGERAAQKVSFAFFQQSGSGLQMPQRLLAATGRPVFCGLTVDVEKT